MQATPSPAACADLGFGVADGSGALCARERLTRDGVPAKSEVVLEVRYRRPLDSYRGVVPAEPASCEVRRRVVRVAAVERQVDPSDKGDPAVDHDCLFVMTVHEPRAGIGLRADLGVASQAVHHLPDVAT